MRPPCFAQLGSLGDLITPDVDIRFAGKHIRPRALAGIADESVSLHVAHDGMRGHRNMHHACSALRTNRIGSDRISS
jgi:hypothetical protein